MVASVVRALVVGVVGVTSACAASPTEGASAPCTPQPPAAAEPSEPSGRADDDPARPASGDVLGEAVAALNEADHGCVASPTDGAVHLCDRARPGRAAFALTHQGPRLFFVSHFLRREGVSCEQSVGVVNALNIKADAVKLVCDDERITFVTDIYVGSGAVDADAVREEVRRFQGVIQLALREEGLRALLR